MTDTAPRGFALPAVLWILVLVGAVSAEFLASAQAERRAVAHRTEFTRARWAARGGMARTLAVLERALATGDAVGRLRSAGDTLHDTGDVVVDGVRVRTVLVDARARLGIDSASAGELVSLQLALDLPRGEAERVAAAVLDWRDPDDRRRGGGGERSAYRAGGLPTRPANRPFAAVEELRRVLGVTRRLYDRLAPHLTVHGDGTQTRDFVHVSDVVRANLLAATTEHVGEAFNVGCGGRVTLNELVDTLNDLLGTDIEPAYDDPRPGDVRHSHADISKARELIGYDPSVSFEDGLERTIEFLQEQPRRVETA
jgi:type II secretory pathway component PulK